MRVRYENWVGGLNGDWLISRQRFFGVAIPLWYPVTADGETDHEHPIGPDESSLPVDPSSDVAHGFTADQRGVPGGFVGEADVMDTWATSSLTPQIAGGWERDPDLFARVFPMDLRPQGQDIIRTWLFSTVVRSHLEHGSLPWAHAAISGWILDPDRKKMSKSKGNVVTPMGLLKEHGSDALRYWAASARLGTDAAFEVGQMKIGRRLAIKVLNASKFVLGITGDDLPDASRVTEALDRGMLAALADVAVSTTSARAALVLALDTILRLLAPVLPFATRTRPPRWRTAGPAREDAGSCRGPAPGRPGPTPSRLPGSTRCRTPGP